MRNQSDMIGGQYRTKWYIIEIYIMDNNDSKSDIDISW